MRLAVLAYGYDVAEYPEEIRDVALSPEDVGASVEEQRETARKMVFDDIYHDKKVAISSNIQACLEAMDEEMDARKASAKEQMQKTLVHQRIMIAVSIVAVIAAILLFLLLVVSPLLKAVTFIQKDQALPVEGSMEFRFLAREYNLMHETNQMQKKELVL